jgi:predicted RNase H-like nuclease
MQKQIQNNDDVVVNFTSPTSIISNLEGVDLPDVVTSNNIEKTATIDIMAQQETTTIENGTCNRFRVTINL